MEEEKIVRVKGADIHPTIMGDACMQVKKKKKKVKKSAQPEKNGGNQESFKPKLTQIRVGNGYRR